MSAGPEPGVRGGDGAGQDTPAGVRLASLSLVLPAHNERDNLPAVLAQVADALPHVAERFDVVIVDDGSSDGTAEVAREQAAALGIAVHVLRHEAKSGYGITVADGLRAADLDWAAFMDADLQFDAHDFQRLVPLTREADLVGGYRLQRNDPFWRSIVSGVYNQLCRTLFKLPVRDVNCAMKLMRTDRLHEINVRCRSAVINAELYWKFGREGWPIRQVGVPHHPRTMGRRSGARLKPIWRAIKELVSLRYGSLSR